MSQFFWPPEASASDNIIEFVLDGVTTEVSKDTSTPANSRPLPVENLNSAGLPIDPATEQKQDDIINELVAANLKLDGVNTGLALIASKQTNIAGSLAQGNLAGTAQTTISPPANAVGCNIQAPSTNEQNIRVIIGGVAASDSSGFLYEPGRSETFNVAADISFCATVAGVNEYIVQWILNT